MGRTMRLSGRVHGSSKKRNPAVASVGAKNSGTPISIVLLDRDRAPNRAQARRSAVGFEHEASATADSALRDRQVGHRERYAVGPGRGTRDLNGEVIGRRGYSGHADDVTVVGRGLIGEAKLRLVADLELVEYGLAHRARYDCTGAIEKTQKVLTAPDFLARSDQNFPDPRLDRC